MIENPLQRIPADSRVAIIRLRSLGDCVLTTPALTLLKRHRPDLRLAVVVEERFAPIFQGNPDVETILPPAVAAIARFKPELVVNFHGGSTSSQLTFASRARWRVGFEHFRFRALYQIRVPRAQQILGVSRKVHTAEHLASAMFYLGVPSQDIPRARLFADPPRGRPRLPYAVLHPKASAADKTWAPERFAAVAQCLKREARLQAIFVAGPGESLDEFSDFECIVGGSLEQIKTLLAHASLFVGNDSGPAHMAAAFGVPVVVLFGTSDPIIWAPWRTESQVLTSPLGIGGITVEAATAAIEQVFVTSMPGSSNE